MSFRPFASRAVAGALLAASILSCGGEGPTQPPPIGGRIEITPATGWVMRGVPYPLAASALDAAGAPVTETSVTFSSGNSAIATVDGAGVLQPLAPGTVTITATGASGRTGTATITVTEKRTITGSIATVDGQPPLALAVTARIGAAATLQRFVAPVNGVTGQVTLDVPALPASAGAMDLYVDAAAGSTRQYHPSLFHVAAGAAPAPTFRALLVPHRITIDSGSYAGRQVAVSLDKAFIPVCTTPGEINCQSYWPSYWLALIRMWPEGARPLPLAIDRTTVPGSISAADSTTLWTTIRAMEAALGRRLYEPATFTGYTSPGFQLGTVLVTIDPTLSAGSGYTNWNSNAQGDLYQARVRFGSTGAIASRGLVAHELTHVLGFSHTCQWPTVMGGYGCPIAPDVSEQDVAYHHLAQLVRRRIAEVQPMWGLTESLAGERMLELQMSAAQVMPASFAASPLRLRVAGADSSGHGRTP